MHLTVIDFEADCCKSKKTKMNHAWFKIDAVSADGSLIVIDHIDLEPRPLISAKNGYIYWKDEKQYELTEFKQAELSVMGLCNDPECNDPECIIAQKKLATNAIAKKVPLAPLQTIAKKVP